MVVVIAAVLAIVSYGIQSAGDDAIPISRTNQEAKAE
jgi:hypothetical protein